MTVKEEINVLEQQLSETRGPGSVAKKEAIQAQIDELQANNAEKEKVAEIDKDIVDNNLVIKGEPLTGAWKTVTVEQVLAAEKAGTLCGYDPIKMIALIKE